GDGLGGDDEREESAEELVTRMSAAAEDANLDFMLEQIPEALEESLTGLGRVAKIVKAMKAFSHPGGEEKGIVDINGSIQTTVTMSRNEWKYVAEMELELADELPVFRGDAGGVNQVLLNMIVNAAHAIGEKNGPNAGATGKIKVQTRDHEGQIEIRIGDSGAGIPEKIRARIFDPFFTTKTVGKGTGQGLSLAHTVVVEQHGGTIAVESEVGEGTTM
ncbi:MAG: histidine kinase, partial [Phycisphaeraceae bacterium]|nr:histidine kinase [Phycisphaeraceae bacterium]